MGYELKPLPSLEDGQRLCCERGCGETPPRQEQFEYSRTEDDTGGLIESKTAPVWRSSCCGSRVFIYDERTGDSRSLDEPSVTKDR
jgi:hypothetical protein